MSQIRSTSFLVRWNFYTNLESINGVCVGYELRYAIKDASPKNWTSRFINSNTTLSITLTDMEENTEYDVIVAGRTKKGSGVFSTPITVKTNEDSEWILNFSKTVRKCPFCIVSCFASFLSKFSYIHFYVCILGGSRNRPATVRFSCFFCPTSLLYLLDSIAFLEIYDI